MAKRSAGLLLYRHIGDDAEVLLVHPGGPYWTNRDDGAWSIPKGEYTEEDPLEAAIREFGEELGTAPLLDHEPAFLGEVRQRGGKQVCAWALEGDLDVAEIHSNTFTMEWPPGGGVTREFPEVDRAEWFGLDDARIRLVPAQADLVDRLAELLAGGT